jgi:hypothetical protein
MFGSRLRIVTTASPPSGSWLVTTEPKNARSPSARNRGNAGCSVTGLLIRISLCPHPNRDDLSALTAMMR